MLDVLAVLATDVISLTLGRGDAGAQLCDHGPDAQLALTPEPRGPGLEVFGAGVLQGGDLCPRRLSDADAIERSQALAPVPKTGLDAVPPSPPLKTMRVLLLCIQRF